LERGDKRYYIVGTAHVSEQSVTDVNNVIDEVQPDSVCVELCEARFTALTDENRWKKLDIFKVIREGKMLFLLANLAIGAYQRRIGADLGVKPGAEMLAGVERAREIDAHLTLADRDIHVTLKRTWANLGFWQKIKLLSAILGGVFGTEKVEAEDIEQLKEQVHLNEMMKEFAEAMPGVKEPLIDERDQYLMSSIEEAPGNTIVAVVGAAHVAGMVRHFGQPVDRDKLDVIPPPSGWTRLLKWIVPLVILGAFTYGYLEHGGRTFEDMLTAWILPNSIVAAVLTAVALARPLSIVTAFVCSPITSLNPLLPSGVVVGLVEAWLRKPTVEDAERINEDAQSIGGVYKNRFTRVLLVAVMSTLGSALGAWVGLGWVLMLVGQ
jgi:pheromone shutdown-related protein TraB